MQPTPSRSLLIVMLASLLAVVVGIPAFQAAHEAIKDKQRPHFLDVFTGLPTKAHLHGWDQSSQDRSVISKALRPMMQQWEYDLLGYTGPKAIAGRGEGKWLFYSPDVQYLLGPAWNDKRFLHNSLDTMIDGRKVNTRQPIYAILDYRDKLKARGIDLLLVPIPGKPSIYPEILDPGLKTPPPSPTEGLIAEMRKQGLEVVDLFGALRDAKAHGADLFLRRDTHWSPAGLDVAAREVAAAVKARSSIAGAAKRYQLRDTLVERWGDVAEMTKLPKRRDLWPLEKVTAGQVVDSAGSPYKDSDSSSILLLGDSYSRIYQTDAPKSAGFIAHIAYYLGMPLSSVVNDGGASTLVRRQLMRKGDLLKGKKLVIWEFVERDIRFGDEGWQLLDLP